MKRQTQICIFACGIIVIAILILFSMMRERETVPKDEGETLVLESEPEPVTESHVEVQPYKYLLLADEGELSVYYYKDKSFYMPTGILVRQLPKSVQSRLKEGICFSDEQELFSFLESYSS